MPPASLLERHGIELIPDAERTRRPRDLALHFAGVQMTFGALLTGALPIAAGLSPGLAVACIVVGNLLGAVAVAAMAPIGIATGANVTVASVAAFGMRGRFLGSAITQLIDIGYVALTLVLAVPAIDAALARLFDIPGTRGITIATMAVTSGLTVSLGLVGQRLVVAAQRLNLAVGAVVIAILAGAALAHPFHAALPTRHPIPIFIGATAVQFANALSWAPYVGDAARYVAPTSSRRRAFLLTLFGMGAGALVSTGAGLLIATRVPIPGDALRGMVDLLPLWLVAPVVAAGALGNAASGAVLVYNGMLDLQAVLWRASRVVAGLLFSGVAVTVAFVALVFFELAGALDAMCVAVGLMVTPWLAVIMSDFFLRASAPDPAALRDFARTTRGNPAWRNNGVGTPALLAWGAGAGLGVLAHLAGRIDAGVPLSAAVSVFVYAALSGREGRGTGGDHAPRS